jgi:hypothetical protein
LTSVRALLNDELKHAASMQHGLLQEAKAPMRVSAAYCVKRVKVACLRRNCPLAPIEPVRNRCEFILSQFTD